MGMTRAQLQKKMASINNLPTLPVVVMEINKLLQDFESPVNPLVETLEKDQSIVSKLLRLVNSSFYGFKSKVNSIRHAVTLLGYNTVRNAVVTVSVIDSLELKSGAKSFNIDEFWRHSIHVAVMSRFIATQSKIADPEDAFTAGLLHDMGKVVLAGFFQNELAQILELMEKEQLTFLDAEEQLAQVPHSAVGSLLAQRWLLPEAFVKAIQYHHSGIDRSDDEKVIRVVDAGNRLVHMMAGEPGYSLNPNPDQPPQGDLLTILSCLKAQQEWLPRIKREMTDACNFFNKG